MLKVIIGASSNEGDLVLDCFCGSGTTLLAADELRRQWIGIDASEAAINTCKKRLSRPVQLKSFSAKVFIATLPDRF